jgi:hypothetical protein
MRGHELVEAADDEDGATAYLVRASHSPNAVFGE